MKLKRRMYTCVSAAIMTAVVGGLMARPAEAAERHEAGETGVSNSPLTGDDLGRHGPTVLHTTDMDALVPDGHAALTLTDLLDALFGGAAPGKVTGGTVAVPGGVIGHAQARGTFSGGIMQVPLPVDGFPGPVGFDSGVILSSGNIIDARGWGPWPAWNLIDWMSTPWRLPGDADLDALKFPGATTDAAGITFTVTIAPNAPQRLTCAYVFGSEEYNEWVPGLPYNDIFGIFVDGVDIARTPAACGGPAGAPVSIHNINGGNPWPGAMPPNRFCHRRWPVFTNDRWPAWPAAPFLEFELDGSTIVLMTTITLTAHATDPVDHAVKLVIADNYDTIYDSDAFIACGLQEQFGRCIIPIVDPPFGCICQNVADVGECTDLGGAFEPDVSCEDADAPCTGACCEGYGTCAITSESECTAGEGTYQGDGTLCGVIGTCTTDGRCVETSLECCPGPGTWATGECEAIGACCLSNGACTEGTPAACDGAEGEYQGDGSLCVPDLCVVHVIPTVSEWGLMVVTLLAMTLGTIMLARRREKRMTGMA